MPAADRGGRFVRRLGAQAPTWVWFISLAFALGVAPVVAAATVHDRCSARDPACVFHSYTLVHTAGPGILGYVGAPALISLVAATLLHIKTTRHSRRANRAAWFFALLSCLISLAGLVSGVLLMLPPSVLTVCAVATAPFPADASDPLPASRTVDTR